MAQPNNNRQHSRIGAVVVALLIVAGAGILILFDPRDEAASCYPPCIFHLLTGLYCPGCGSTRALARLLHLDLAGAWRYNPLTVLVVPYIGYYFLAFQVETFTRHRLPRPAAGPFVTWAIVVGVMLFWILRNLPATPFSFLAPG